MVDIITVVTMIWLLQSGVLKAPLCSIPREVLSCYSRSLYLNRTRFGPSPRLNRFIAGLCLKWPKLVRIYCEIPPIQVVRLFCTMGSKGRTPPDLPGMYFDAERNRYFPLKTPTVAYRHSRLQTASEQLSQDEEIARNKREDALLHKRRIANKVFAAMEKSEDGNAVLRLVQQRELSGHSWKRKLGTNSFAFQRLMLETHAGPMNSGQPVKTWSYDSVHCDGGIEQCRLDLQTAEGLVEVDSMVAGGFNEVQILQVCGPEDAFVWGDDHVTSPINLFPCPLRYEDPAHSKAPVLRPVFVKLPFSSMITSVKKLNEWREEDTADNGRHLTQNIILTTLGNGGEGGSIYLMRAGHRVLNEPSRPFSRRFRVQVSDIYTAECNPRGREVSLGLKGGAAILDVERGEISRTFVNKSSVLAQQFDHSGNLLFCGHRNGMIVTYDLRLPPPSSSQTQQRGTGGKVSNYQERMQMRSTVCSMCVFRSCEHYLVASAMNGEIWQWDRRMGGRGPVQTFEGHVNSHSLLELRLDPSERLLASGGTDNALRLWSVKSGRLLHVERKLGCVPKRICWNSSYLTQNAGRWDYFEEPRFEDDSPWAMWTGSTRLLHMRGGYST